MDLGTNPVARLFVDSFVMLLSGNRAGLEKMFKMQLTPKPGPGNEWRLLLTPRVAPMDKMIKELELRGRGLNLEELDVRETQRRLDAHLLQRVDVEPPLQRRRAGAVLQAAAQMTGPTAPATRLRLGIAAALTIGDGRVLRAAAAGHDRHHSLPARRDRPPRSPSCRGGWPTRR